MSDFELIRPSSKDKTQSLYGGVIWIATFEALIAPHSWRLMLPERKSAKWNKRRHKTRAKMLARFVTKTMQSYNLNDSKYDKTAYALSLM